MPGQHTQPGRRVTPDEAGDGIIGHGPFDKDLHQTPKLLWTAVVLMCLGAAVVGLGVRGPEHIGVDRRDPADYRGRHRARRHRPSSNKRDHVPRGVMTPAATPAGAPNSIAEHCPDG